MKLKRYQNIAIRKGVQLGKKRSKYHFMKELVWEVLIIGRKRL